MFAATDWLWTTAAGAASVVLVGWGFRRLGFSSLYASGWKGVAGTLVGVALAAILIWTLQNWGHGWSPPSPAMLSLLIAFGIGSAIDNAIGTHSKNAQKK